MAERRTKYFANGHALDPYRVTPDGRWKVSKVYVYPKDCNERSGKFLLDNFDRDSGRDFTLVRLVHGYFMPPVMPFGIQHAWVDLGTGVVFDGVLQGFYDAAGYAEVYRTEEVVRYTVEEAIHLMTEHRHWGPWHPAVREHQPLPPSALPELNAYILLGGKRRPGSVGLQKDGQNAVVLLREDVGPVGQNYYLAGDSLSGRCVGKHKGMPLYEPAASGGTPTEGVGEGSRSAAKKSKPTRRRGTSRP